MKKAILCLLLCLLLLPTAVFADETPAPAQAEGAAGTSAPAESAAPTESAAPAESAAPTATAAQEGTFAILHTGDTHGVQERSGDSIGYPLLRSLADNTRSAYETLLLDSGNALEGDGRKTVKLMGAATYDAAAIGTEDAALGIERLQELSAIADFPLLCANWLRQDGELLFDPYAIFEVDGVRIGVIGLISPEIAELYPDITEGCNVYKPSGIANIYYEEMANAGCTYFIALTSLGYDGEYTPRDLAAESPWLNLILDSNTDTVLEDGELVPDTNVVVFNLPKDFTAVGSLVVTTTSGQNILSPSVLTLDDLSVLTPNEAVTGVAQTDYSVDGESAGGGLQIPAGAVFLIALVVIAGLTVLLVAVVLRRKTPRK